MDTPTSGGSSESETSDETVTPIRSPSTSTLRIETPCGQSRIRPRSASPVAIARTLAVAGQDVPPPRHPRPPHQSDGRRSGRAGSEVQIAHEVLGQGGAVYASDFRAVRGRHPLHDPRLAGVQN